MYAALYGYDVVDGKRKHLGNVINIEYTTTLRTYDFNTASIRGATEVKMDDPLIYVINDDRGNQIFSGFTKNYKPSKDNTKSVSFVGDDLKKILDTDILLDFSSDGSFALSVIFAKVTNAVLASNRDDFMSKLSVQFVIPVDALDTKIIADYTGQYLIVNALKFLKVYLSYYEYYIKTTYDIVNDTIIFEFTKSNPSEIIQIKLKDFIHEITSSDIKVNKTVATIKYNTISDEPSWVESDSSYYASQPAGNKSSLATNELPDPNGYAPGFALRLQNGSNVWTTATASDYNNATSKLQMLIGLNETFCAVPSLGDMMGRAGDSNQYSVNTVIKFNYFLSDGTLCSQTAYLKRTASTPTYDYYKLSDVTYIPRPSLPEKIYLLGKDNKIYDGYQSIAESNRIYPVVSKIFEAEFLSEAQVNAVYELANSRYMENIIITDNNVAMPIDLESLELYSMIRAYDDNGNFKDIPISEKTYIHNSKNSYVEIKLGFKRTLLTEIIKEEVAVTDVVKKTGGNKGVTNVIQQNTDIQITDASHEPDPNNGGTWFMIDD